MIPKDFADEEIKGNKILAACNKTQYVKSNVILSGQRLLCNQPKFLNLKKANCGSCKNYFFL